MASSSPLDTSCRRSTPKLSAALEVVASTGGEVARRTGAGTGEEVGDPDTGICGRTPQASAGGAAAQVGGVLPTTLDQDSRWGTTESLMLLVGLFTLGLVFIPALAWRRMTEPSSAAQPVATHQPISHDQVSV
jgi:hypothetical protein